MVGGTNMEDDMQDGMAIDGLGVRSCRCHVNLRQNVHNSIRFLACCSFVMPIQLGGALVIAEVEEKK